MQWQEYQPTLGWTKPTSDMNLDVAEGTPFQGGVFKMKLILGSDFPSAPPKGKFPSRFLLMTP